MGVVYEAFDRERRSVVAIKTLLRMEPAGLLRFKNEFRSLSDLSHPNLVRLGELLEENGQLFFTMELVHGVPFVEYARGVVPEMAAQARRSDADTVPGPLQSGDYPSPEAAENVGHLDETKVRKALSQLAHGLEKLHSKGRIHRDIKPSNVLVTADGRVVILDFGLVTEAAATFSDEDEHVVGTAHFMAPEQARGAPLGPAADFYAVGVMLYEALTGVLPFDVAQDAVAAVKQKTMPLPPTAVAKNVPSDLDALTMRLLQIDPQKRAGAADIFSVLGEEPAPLSTLHTSVGAIGFVGRHAELQEIEQAFAEARAGRVRAMFVEGESGVGKTTLGRKFLDRAQGSALVLAGRCYERESVPYKAVDGVIDRLGTYLARLPAAHARALLPPDMDLAASVFPVLAIATRSSVAPVPSATPELGDPGLVLDLLSAEPLSAAQSEKSVARPVRGDANPTQRSPHLTRSATSQTSADDEGPAERQDTAPQRDTQSTEQNDSEFAEITPSDLQGPRSFVITEPPPHVIRMEPAEVRGRVFVALRELFSRLARQMPVILAIDDLQWADADSIALLSEILRVEPGDGGTSQAAAAPIFLLASVRAASENKDSGRLELSLRPDLIRRLSLLPLPPDEARDLVSKLLRALAQGSFEATSLDVASLLAEGSGHPLFLDALVRHRLGGAANVGNVRLDDALWARVNELAPRARMLLTIICVAGGPLASRVAQHALSAEREELERMLAFLRAEHFARTHLGASDETLEPYHDRIRETVAARLTPDERRRWHAKLAVALETMGDGELSQLSVHWREAGDLARAAEYAARGGDEAAAAFAFDRAGRQYAEALSLLPQNASERASLQVRLGDAWSNGGRGAEAASAYLSAAALYPEGSALELRRRAAESYLRSGYIDEGMSHLRAVLSSVNVDFPETPSAALTSLLFRRAELRLRGLGFSPRKAGEITPFDLRRVDVCWSAAQGLGMVDVLRGAYFQVRCLLFALAAGDSYRVARSLALELGFVATAGPKERGRVDDLLRAAREAAEMSRHPHALAMVTAISGVRLFLEGRFREALAPLSEGEHLLRTKCLNTSWEIGSTLTFSLWALWMLGDYRAFTSRAPAALREAEERGDRYLATNLCSGFTNALWLVQDDLETASLRAESAIGPWSQLGTHLQHFHDVVARVHIDLYRGDGASAHRHIVQRWKSLDEAMSFRVQIVRVTCEYLRGATAIAAAQSESAPSMLLAIATKSARKLLGERVAWATSLSALLRAGVRHREGETGTAVTSLLEEAARSAAQCGMDGYGAAARRAIGWVRGGPAGAGLLVAAEADLSALGVRNPARFAAMLVPGFSG